MSKDIKDIDCEEAVKLIFGYLDEELENHDHAAIEKHLNKCRACYSHMEFEKKLKNTIADQKDEEASGDLRNRIKSISDLF